MVGNTGKLLEWAAKEGPVGPFSKHLYNLMTEVQFYTKNSCITNKPEHHSCNVQTVHH